MDRLPEWLKKYVGAAEHAHWADCSSRDTYDWMYNAILAFLNAAEKDGWAMVQTKGNVVLPEQAFGFLMGTDSLAGRWFGDDHVGRPKYWWRTEIRAMIDAAKEERS